MKSYMLVKKFEIEVVLLQVLCHNFKKVCIFLVNIRLLSIKILKLHSQTYFFPTLAPDTRRNLHCTCYSCYTHLIIEL